MLSPLSFLGSLAGPLMSLGNTQQATTDTATPNQTTTDTSGGLTTVKSPAVKGGFGYGTVALDPTNSQAILDNMQSYLDKRNSPWSQIQRNLEDASMAGISNIHGDYSRAVNAKRIQDLEESKDYLQTTNQMAALKSAQATQALIRAQLANEVGGGGAGTSSATGTNPTNTGGTVGTSADNALDPDTIKYLNNIAQTDPAKAQEEYGKIIQEKNKAILNRKYSPTKDSIVEYATPWGNIQMTQEQADELSKLNPNLKLLKSSLESKNESTVTSPVGKPTFTGEDYKVAANVNNPAGILDSTGKFKAYNTPQDGVAATQSLLGQYLSGQGPMAGIATTPENIVGVWTHGDASKGASEQNGSYAKDVRAELAKAGVTLNDDGTIPNTPQANAALATAHIKHEAGPNADKFLPYVSTDANLHSSINNNAANTTNISSQNTIDTANFGNKERNTADEEIRKQKKLADVEAQKKYKEEVNTSAAKDLGKLNEIALKSQDTIDSATHIIKVSSDPAKQKLFAPQSQKSPASAILAGTEGVPIVGNVAKGLLTKNPITGMYSQPEIAERNNIQSEATKLGIDYAMQAFAGTRMTNGFTKLAAEAKGVGPDIPWQTNQLMSNVIREKAAFNKAAAQDYAKFSKEAQKNDEFVTFNDYVNSDRFKRLEDDTQARLVAKYPQYFSPNDQRDENGIQLFKDIVAPTAQPTQENKFSKYYYKK